MTSESASTGAARAWWLCGVFWGLLLCCGQVSAKAYVLVAGGLGGNADYTESFASIVEAIEENFTPENQWLGGETEVSVLHGESASKEAIERELTKFASSITPQDSLVLMLVGHGSYDGEHYRFNVPGPDLGDRDIKQALDAISAGQQLVVLGTSASGVMLQQLTQPGRIVITATKSGGEINAVVFPRYWATALSTDKADFDRNEIVTVEEAFRFTQNAVNAHYGEQNLLASEHARMLGDHAARQAVALIGSLKGAGNNPEIVTMLEQRATLEGELQQLRQRKPSTDTSSYYTELQELMLRMARLQLDIDRHSGWLEAGE